MIGKYSNLKSLVKIGTRAHLIKTLPVGNSSFPYNSVFLEEKDKKNEILLIVEKTKSLVMSKSAVLIKSV
jgi:hypothetical protein